MIYIASPYSHADPVVMQARYDEVCRIICELLKQGLPVYSPIVHNHYLTQRFHLPTDHVFWMKYNGDMMNSSTHIIVIKMEGWEQSKGVHHEIEYCKRNGIPVKYMEA
jgi:hypothetical protein